jgi:DNA-binding transcriptional MerR regulator
LLNFNEKDLTKLYYSIGEVAEIFQVNASLIRFWEKEFDLKVAKKNAKGNRLFTVSEIKHFNKIYQLVKVEGFTLDGAKKVLKQGKISKIISKPEDTISNTEVIENLEKIKEKLKKLKGN